MGRAWHEAAWVVADLKRKKELERWLLRRLDFIYEAQVLRMSELWSKEFLFRNPDYKIVSHSFLQVLAREFLVRHQRAEVLADTNSDSTESEFTELHEADFIRHLRWLAPFVFAEVPPETIGEWNESISDSGGADQVDWRWMPFVAKFLEQLQISQRTSVQWVPWMMSDVRDLQSLKRPIVIVDLGLEIKMPEVELWQRVAETKEVHILIPELRDDFLIHSPARSVLRLYENLRTRSREDLRARSRENSQVRSETSLGFGEAALGLPLEMEPSSVEKQAEAGDFGVSVMVVEQASLWSEVVNAAMQVKRWRALGVGWENILLIYPIDSEYVALIDRLFSEFAIPLELDRAMAPLENSSVQEFLSLLKVWQRDFTFADLETLYAIYDKGRPSYREFKRRWAWVHLQEESLAIRQWLFPEEPALAMIEDLEDVSDEDAKPVTLEAWMAEWPQALQECLAEASTQSLLEDLWLEVHTDDAFSRRIWLELLLAKAQQIRSVAEDEVLQNSTLACSLEGALSVHRTHRIFLGLAQENFRAAMDERLSHFFFQRSQSDLGVGLPPDLSWIKEANFAWLKQSHAVQSVFSFARKNSRDEDLLPLLEWQKIHSKSENSGEVMRAESLDFSQVLAETSAVGVRAQQRGLEEMKLHKNVSRTQHARLGPKALSPSGLEDFLTCPFVFFVKRILQFPDQDPEIWTLDPLERGQLYHRLAELILANEVTSREVAQGLLEQCLREQRESWDPLVETQMKARLEVFVDRFLDSELEFRRDFPGWKTIATEMPFVVSYDRESGEMSLGEKPGAWIFRGKIDRVDLHEESQLILLYDYKSSTGARKSFQAWQDEPEIQLSFYAWLIAKKVLLPEYEVGGALYYSFATMERRKGVLRRDLLPTGFPDVSKQAVTTASELASYLESWEDQLKKTLDFLAQSDFTPRPADPKECLTCRWNTTCKAPHLIQCDL